MSTLVRDLRFAFRSLSRSPGFTFGAMITLALGIAGTIVVFSVLNASLLFSLPFPQPQRLVLLHWKTKTAAGEVSAQAFFAVKTSSHSLKDVAALYPIYVGVNVAGIEPPQYVKALKVSQGFFRTLQATPVLGRDFTAEEDLPGGSWSCIISYDLWDRAFGRNSSALGREILINGEKHTIVGITPRGFHSYPEADLWLPLQLSNATSDPGSDYRVIGRVADGFSFQQVREELKSISEQHNLRYLSIASADKDVLTISSLQDFLIGKNRDSLMIVFAAVVFVLMIACANVAVLLLVRTVARYKETCIRAALGAGRARLIQGFLIESFLLALGTGLVGIMLAKELIPLVLFIVPADLPLRKEINVDIHVLGFAVLATLFSWVLFGFLPAFIISGTGTNSAIDLLSHSSARSPEQMRLIRLLVTLEITLTVVLLSGTALLLETLVKLHTEPSGFDTRHAMVAQISLAGNRYSRTAPTVSFLDQTFTHIRSYPGIKSVSSVVGLPLEKGLNLPLYPVASPNQLIHATEYRVVAGDYFLCMGIPLVDGRDFSAADNHGSTAVAIVNETLAQRWWPNKSAVGQVVNVGNELGPAFSDTPRLIVGVTRDVRETNLSQAPNPTVFVPMAQLPDNLTAFVNRVFLTSIVVRTANNASIFPEVKAAVRSAGPDLPIASFRSLNQVVNESLSGSSFVTFLSAAFGCFALFVTAIGLYGLLSYQISLRTKEIAVRIAIGADRFDVVKTIIRQGLGLSAIGVLLGMVLLFFFKKLLASLLYNINAGSILSLVTTISVIGAISVLVSLLAALRALSFELVTVLRNE